MDESSAIKQLNQLEKRTDTIGNKILKKIAKPGRIDARASKFHILS